MRRRKRNSDTAMTAAASRMAVWASEIMELAGILAGIRGEPSPLSSARSVPMRHERCPTTKTPRLPPAAAPPPHRRPRTAAGCLFRRRGGRRGAGGARGRQRLRGWGAEEAARARGGAGLRCGGDAGRLPAHQRARRAAASSEARVTVRRRPQRRGGGGRARSGDRSGGAARPGRPRCRTPSWPARSACVPGSWSSPSVTRSASSPPCRPGS